MLVDLLFIEFTVNVANVFNTVIVFSVVAYPDLLIFTTIFVFAFCFGIVIL